MFQKSVSGWTRSYGDESLVRELVRRTDLAATLLMSDPMAMPITTATIAVAAFAASGAVVLNGKMATTTVTRPTIQPKKVSGRGVLSSSR
jgi:hypothetical protein